MLIPPFWGLCSDNRDLFLILKFKLLLNGELQKLLFSWKSKSEYYPKHCLSFSITTNLYIFCEGKFSGMTGHQGIKDLKGEIHCSWWQGHEKEQTKNCVVLLPRGMIYWYEYENNKLHVAPWTRIYDTLLSNSSVLLSFT